MAHAFLNRRMAKGFMVLTTSFFILSLSGEQVQAGFEWAPPKPKQERPQEKTSDIAAQPAQVPVKSYESEILSPMPGELEDQDLTPIYIEENLSESRQQAGGTVSAPVSGEESPAPVMRTITATAPDKDLESGGEGHQPLSINPYPLRERAGADQAPVMTRNGHALPAKAVPAQPQASAMPKEAFSEVVGFGSDIPLALALRQVVPADYAFVFGEGVNPGYRTSWNGGRPWNEVVAGMLEPLGLEARIQRKIVKIHLKGAETGGHAPVESRVAAPPSESRRQGTENPVQNAASARTNITDLGIYEQFHETSAGTAGAAATQDYATAGSGTSPADKDQTMSQPRIWEARQGDSLRETLQSWSKQANITLVWHASHDFSIHSNVLVNGTFDNAVKVLFASMADRKANIQHKLLNSEEDIPTALIIQDHLS